MPNPSNPCGNEFTYLRLLWVRTTEYKDATNRYTEQRGEMLFFAAVLAPYFAIFSLATPVLWEGRPPPNYTEADIDESFGPYLRYVVASTVRPSSYMKGS